MSYLRFDRSMMVNLEESLQREVLRTNRSGAYHCTTIVDCNTRIYHGLLVIPIPDLDNDNHVLLSSLDETVIQHNAEFNLGLHQYQGGNFNPNGHKYIREFECEKVPTTTYRVGGVVLKKEKVFVHHENRILIRYTLVDAHSPTKLRFRPFVAFRSVREFTHENLLANKDYQEVENGIKMCLYEGYPDLYMQLNKKNTFHSEPYWYKGFEYSKEKERGYDSVEDLYVPGYFEVDIKKGESIVFSAGVEVVTKQLKKLFQEEVEDRTPRNSFLNCLINSAHQFHNKQGNEHYILAGYPWFKCRARDLFISLPGLTLDLNEIDEFETAMETAQKAILAFIRNEEVDPNITEIAHPDVLLWAIWCLQQYAKHVSRKDCFMKYGDLLEEIMDFIRKEKHPNLFLHENGLLYSNGTDKAITWMNASVNGSPVTPRTGYIVEFNALWYNALCFVGELFKEEGKEYFSYMLEEISNLTRNSFVQVFRNEHGYLFDYVNGQMLDWSVRPNMIFAIAFDYSPLELPQRKQILDIVTKELLTPKGLRTLSPKSGGYNPNYVGNEIERNYAYHQGTAWPWLFGFYVEAYLRIYKISGLSFIERQLIGYEEEMTRHCIGSIAELFDGNPPFKGRGAVSFALNIAQLIHILKLVEKYNL